MLRDTLVWHDGTVGSPVFVASVMSAVTAVRYGNGPAAGMISAPARASVGGGGGRCGGQIGNRSGRWDDFGAGASIVGRWSQRRSPRHGSGRGVLTIRQVLRFEIGEVVISSRN